LQNTAWRRIIRRRLFWHGRSVALPSSTPLHPSA
jgi:hypothetical protein